MEQFSSYVPNKNKSYAHTKSNYSGKRIFILICIAFGSALLTLGICLSSLVSEVLTLLTRRTSTDIGFALAKLDPVPYTVPSKLSESNSEYEHDRSFFRDSDIGYFSIEEADHQTGPYTNPLNSSTSNPLNLRP